MKEPKYKINEDVVYKKGKSKVVSKVVKIIRKTFVNEEGKAQIDDIYTLADKHTFIITIEK